MALDTWVPGMLVTERFELEQLASQGGMGLIFRARDRHTGAPVALKLLHASAANPQNMERLLRESQVLAEVRHPGIVGYMGHGRTSQGEVFLAMEWLSGENLGQRLRRQSLTLGETMVLGRRVAEALAAVHERGIVHRDIKPSNLFLRGGEVDQVTLVDFGLARGGLAWSVTRTGELVGTLQYLAPEQVRGDRLPGPAVDIYALGCVLSECLTGEPPLGGDNVAMLLMRILVEEPPSLRQRRPELPEALAVLVQDMLRKEPGRRPAHGGALLARLEALGLPVQAKTKAPVAEVPQQLGRDEQRLVSIILAAPRLPLETSPEGAPERPEVRRFTSSLGGTPYPEGLLAELAEQLRPYGARIDQVLDGTLIATLAADETATDQAVRAARCAWLLKQRLPQALVVLATGRGMLSEVLPVGDVIQRVGQVLAAGQAMVRDVPEGEDLAVYLDELTAKLLNGRFHLRKAEPGVVVLEGERGVPDETRRLLGRATPCVGREQELQLLAGMFTDCVEADCAQAVLILGPAGMGKSRLRHEFLHRLRLQGEAVEVLQGRGDPILRGTPYVALGQALRRLCEIEEDMPLEVRRERLEARLGRHVAAQERRAVRDFLGELCGVPFPDEDSAPLRAARQDPRLMNDQMGKALLTLLRGECAVHPVVLVLEDLQWIDTATVHLVDVALRDLENRRLLVLGLGRPEVKDLLPRLWQERRCQEVRLHGLSRKACEQLVRKALGPEVAAETVARLVERAGGHALFLEELVRAVAEGEEELPETVLAMLQVRFLRLAPGARQLLRAASLFGNTFWRGGLMALLGLPGKEMEGKGKEGGRDEPTEPTEIDRWLTLLAEQEMILLHGECRFPGEVQYGFRHALVREAAYSLLTEEDRQRGHRAVGEYLERMGETDALVVAEHYRWGQHPERAARFYARAAAHALESSNSLGAVAWAARGIECGASGELLGALRGTEAWGLMWQGDLVASCEAALAALPCLPVGSPAWYQASAAVVATTGSLGRVGLLGEQLRSLAMAEPLPEAESTFMEPSMAAVVCCCFGGMREMGGHFLRRMEAAAGRLGANEARTRGLFHLSELWTRLVLDGDPWMYWCAARKGVAAFAEAEDLRYRGCVEGHLGFGYALLGEREQAVALFRASLPVLERLGETIVLLAMRTFFVMALGEMGDPALLEEAQVLIQETLAQLPSTGFWRGLACCAQACVLLARRDFESAAQATEQAFAAFAALPTGQALALTWRCRALLEQGRAAEAHVVGEQGLTLLATLGGRCWMDEKLRLGAAEARHATGDAEGARRVLAEAWREFRRRAAQLEDPVLRERFVQARDNVRLRELVLAWGLVVPSGEASAGA